MHLFDAWQAGADGHEMLPLLYLCLSVWVRRQAGGGREGAERLLAQLRNDLFRRQHIRVLCVDIEEIGVMRGFCPIGDGGFRNNAVKAVLDGIDNRGTNATAGGGATDNKRIDSQKL